MEPGAGAFVCSCHFPKGDRENLPVLFKHNAENRFSCSSPEKRKRRSNPESTVVEPQLPKAQEESPNDMEIQPQPSTSGLSAGPSAVVLESEIFFLRQKVADYETTPGRAFSFKDIEGKDSLCKLYTGLPTVAIFMTLFALLENIPIAYYLGWNVEKMPKIDQLLMCLMKLRQNFPHVDLAERFRVSQATVTNVVITWVHVLHEILFQQFMSRIPSRAANLTCLPSCFSNFTNCRIVLDCTEMATTVPGCIQLQKSTYSSYKHRNTWKALIGVAPNGVITYVSSLYPGAMSDKKIVQHCGILEQLEAGDLILADKGFLLKDLLPPGVNLNIPPFLTTAQFTPAQIKQTESIARARIHVERAIQRMKQYKILALIPRSLFEHGGIVVQVIGALTNLQYPLLEEVKQSYSS